MRQANTWILLLGIPVLIAGCAVGGEPTTGKIDLPLFSTQVLQSHLAGEGIIDFGTTVFATNPTTLLEPLDFHRYEFQAHAGGTVTITATATNCGDPDVVIDLFTQADLDAGGTQLIENDDGGLPCALDSQISNFTLPSDTTYELIVRSFRQAGSTDGGHYQLTMICTNNACALAGAPDASTVRVNQADIDNGLLTAQQLFDVGDFTYKHIFTVAEGLGNALAGAPGNGTGRPAFRNIPNNVHFAAFGSPEAQSCVTCHNLGGDDGAGDRNHDIFQIGDGINRASGVERNPPTVLGNGYRQRIGEEMTADLQGILNAAKAQVASTHVAVTKALTSKGISFGSVTVNADGTVNFGATVGVDTDLIIKPFGWKGREATLKRFVEGSFRVHFGIQSQPQVDGKCPNTNLLGTGACPDPDGDGVVNELTEGGLSAMAVYMGLREIPVRVPAITAAAQARANSGESLFKSVGCATCHTQFMTLNSPIHVEAADSVANHGTGGNGITLNLAVNNKDPKPAVNADGSITIEVFSDFKRHDVGAALADNQPFNQIAANQFITPPLWGISVSAPYLHDGRARALQDAILQHAGDAQTVRNNFTALTADQQSQVVEFLLTLGRQENVDAQATKVNLSNFLLKQIKPSGTNFILTQAVLPAGTLVPPGGRVIIARNATLAQFQAFYGRTLDTNTLFFTGGNVFPTISGGEQFALFDSNNDATTLGVGTDGFTFPEAAGGGQTLQRKDCGLISTQAASWNIVASTPASATPGIAPLSTGLNRICITEVADSPSNSNFEFIEIFVEGQGSGSTSGGAQSAHATACKAAHGFQPLTSGPDTLHTSQCPPTGCGLNGFWLGANVPFRTLHTNPSRVNEMGLSILSAKDEHGNSINIDVQNDVLGADISYTINGQFFTTFTPAKNNWQLNLGEWVTGPSGGSLGITKYILYINQVINKPFWAQPNDFNNTSPGYTFPDYVFTAVSLEDQCDIEVCKPELDSDGVSPGISGNAVIFRGDFYANNYTVQLSAPAPPDYNNDLFNIACLGTTLAKLHRLRHTSASQVTSIDPTNIPTQPQRQTLLKLLAADYCGDGIPFTHDQASLPFTVIGLPIGLGFANSFYNLTPESGYSISPSSMDALWNDKGATCITTTPRLWEANASGTITTVTGPSQSTILNTCKTVDLTLTNPPQACTMIPLSLSKPFLMSSYAASGNPD